jgi:hypothetical protein
VTKIGPFFECMDLGGVMNLRSLQNKTNRRFLSIQKLSVIIFGLFLLTQFNNCSKVSASAINENLASQGIVDNGESKITTSIVKPDDGRVDIILVFDDSGSMRQDSLNLAAKLSGFVTELENSQIDWQMCVITTDLQGLNGNSINWVGNPDTINRQILKKGVVDLDSIFTDTVTEIFKVSGSGDERGIAALLRHLEKRNQNNCYREGAALSTIVISDEDERSVGGNQALNPGQYRPLEEIDYAKNYFDTAKLSLGSNGNSLRMIANSVVIKSGDAQCLSIQAGQPSSVGFYGLMYEALSNLTNGKIGDICAADYTATLKDFADQIKKSLISVSLDCIPSGTPQVSFTPNPGIQYHLENQSLILDTVISQNISVQVNYQCGN